MLSVNAVTNRAEGREESEQIREQNENENSGEKPKSFSHELMTYDALEERVETFYQPFEEILSPRRHCFHFASGDLSKNDQNESDTPRDHHGVCDRKPPNQRHLWGPDFDCLGSQSFFMVRILGRLLALSSGNHSPGRQ